MANSWFRTYTEWGTDPKVQMMSEAMQRRLIMLFCLRGSDSLETLQETELAFYMHISYTELAETKIVFLSKGFIDENWNVLNWDKRQFASDVSTKRVREHRERKKQDGLFDSSTDEPLKRYSNTPEQNRTETEQKQSKAPPSGFVLPDYLDREVWNGYEEMRRKIRKPLTDRARSLAIAELARLRTQGCDPDAVLNQSILNSWQGLFELKSNGAKNGAHNGHYENPFDRARRKVREEVDEKTDCCCSVSCAVPNLRARMR